MCLCQLRILNETAQLELGAALTTTEPRSPIGLGAGSGTDTTSIVPVIHASSSVHFSDSGRVSPNGLCTLAAILKCVARTALVACN